MPGSPYLDNPPRGLLTWPRLLCIFAVVVVLEIAFWLAIENWFSGLAAWIMVLAVIDTAGVFCLILWWYNIRARESGVSEVGRQSE